MATPDVTGVLALIKALFPQDSYSRLLQRVATGVTPVASLSGQCVTSGRLNLLGALGIPAPPVLKPARLAFSDPAAPVGTQRFYRARFIPAQ